MTEDGLEPGPCKWCGGDKDDHDEGEENEIDHEYEEESHLETIARLEDHLNTVQVVHDEFMQKMKTWVYLYAKKDRSGLPRFERFYSRSSPGGMSVLDSLVEHVESYQVVEMEWPMNKKKTEPEPKPESPDPKSALMVLEDRVFEILSVSPKGPPVSVDFQTFHNLQDAFKDWREHKELSAMQPQLPEKMLNRLKWLTEQLKVIRRPLLALDIIDAEIEGWRKELDGVK